MSPNSDGLLSKNALEQLAEEARLSGYDDVYKESHQVVEPPNVALNKMRSSEGLVDASDV